MRWLHNNTHVAYPLFEFRVVTPAQTLVTEQVQRVRIPTEMGPIEVYANHAPLIGIVVPGELEIQLPDDTVEYYAVAGGMIEAGANKLIVLADSVERPSDIDIAESEKRAELLAQQLREQRHLHPRSYEMLETRLKLEVVRLTLARQHSSLPAGDLSQENS